MSLKWIELDLEEKVISGSVIKEDSQILINYLTHIHATKTKLSDRSLITIYECILPWTKYLSLNKATIKEVYSANSQMKGRGLKKNTLTAYISHFKRFLVWRNKHGNKIDLAALDEIEIPGIDRVTKTSKDILTEDEIKKIIMASGRVRDRALFFVMYEGGCRPVDLYEMQWKQVEFTDHNVVITTKGKVKNKPRRIPLYSSAGYLVQWRDDYPGTLEGDNYVFVSLRKPHEPIGYRGLQTAFHRAVRLSGIDKKKSMYFFRHSHVTHLSEAGISDAVNKKLHWGSETTNMLGTYSHISDPHVDETMAIYANVEPPKKKRSQVLKAVQCPRCATVNPPGANRCYHCSKALSDEAKTEEEQLFHILLEAAKSNPEKVLEALKKANLEPH